jgi:hypothetical protein
MRTVLVLVTAVGLAAASVGADEPAKKDKPQVREIDAKGLGRQDRGVDATKPTVITSAEELAKVFPDEEVQKRLKKEVDFSKEKMLFFDWGGSGGDKLTFTETKGDKGLEVVFSYRPGQTDDLRHHTKLYVLPKNATWKFGAVKE